MARVFQTPNHPRPLAPVDPRHEPELLMEKLEEGKINLGMITTVEPSNLSTSAMVLVQNARVRYDLTTRRPGSVLFVPASPDSNAPLVLHFVKKKGGLTYTIRHSAASAHSLEAGVWTPIAFDAPLHGGTADRLNCIDVLDTYCFSNNGADSIQTIDFVAHTGVQLGNAPKYRYITGFYNRCVGLALRDSNEVQIGWSADGVPTQWDPTIDQTAGSTPLLESPSDLSDYIKGGFAFTNVMVILREKSVWLATKQPIPTNPFYFYSAIPGIGCDTPYSAQLINGGIAWVDRRTRAVYAYVPGSTGPESIGGAIDKELVFAISDPNAVFSSYDPTYNEYTVFIPSPTSNIVQGWTYSFKSKTWTYNEYYALSCASNAELDVGGNRIMDLVGSIENLKGAIDQLSIRTLLTNQSYGRLDGSITIEDSSTDTEASYTGFPSGIPFVMKLVSKTFRIPSNDIYIAQVCVEYNAIRPGNITLEYSIDDGNTWRQGKTVTPSVLGKSALLIMRKVIKCRRFIWRLTTTAGLFEPLSYEIWVSKGGYSIK